MKPHVPWPRSILTIVFPQWDEKGTGPIQPETLARHVDVARRESRKDSAGNPSFVTSWCLVSWLQLDLFWLDNLAIEEATCWFLYCSCWVHHSTPHCYAISLAMRSAKPTLGRLFAMMDLRRHLARIAPLHCSLTSLEPLGGWWGGDTSERTDEKSQPDRDTG